MLANGENVLANDENVLANGDNVLENGVCEQLSKNLLIRCKLEASAYTTVRIAYSLLKRPCDCNGNTKNVKFILTTTVCTLRTGLSTSSTLKQLNQLFQQRVTTTNQSLPRTPKLQPAATYQSLRPPHTDPCDVEMLDDDADTNAWLKSVNYQPTSLSWEQCVPEKKNWFCWTSTNQQRIVSPRRYVKDQVNPLGSLGMTQCTILYIYNP